jgi:hypothetical protein
MGKVTGANGAFVGTLRDEIAALVSSATIAVDASAASLFTLVPAHTATLNVSGGVSGEHLTLRVLTSGTTSYTLTFGTGFSSTGTLATGTTDAKVFVVSFVHDGTAFREVARTAAQ